MPILAAKENEYPTNGIALFWKSVGKLCSVAAFLEMGEMRDGSFDLNKKGHVLLLPYSGQGHINPILQFGKRLASKGLKITFATTVHFSKSMHLKDCKFGVEVISDGFDENGIKSAESGEILLRAIKEVGSRTLSDLIKRYTQAGCEPITCLVCDSIFPWALDVGKQHGLVTASFYTQPCSVSSIFYHVRQGNLAASVEDKSITVSLPGLPQLDFHDLPASLTNSLEPDKTGLVFLLGQYSNTEKADWLLFNTFDELESEVLKFTERVGRVRAIGPAIPSMYLDKRIDGDKEHILNAYKPTSIDYIKWLNRKKAGSVLYISFGSVAELGEEQMAELCGGIKQSNRDFFWVVREKEESKLPDGFAEEVQEKGLLVPWCSQLEVLAHEAVGCFLTHCGWNSTMEALSLGVPMVAMPRLSDQLTNAKFIQDVWGLGVRVKKDEQGIVRRGELESCIRQVMEGERGQVIKTNAVRWRELAKEAVDVGGSSDLNTEEFSAYVTKDYKDML